MSDSDLLTAAAALLKELDSRRSAAHDHVEARNYSVCYTHTEDAYLRLRHMLKAPTRQIPAMIHVEQLVGGVL